MQSSLLSTMPLTDTMTTIKVPPNLPELVRTRFAAALASGDVNFYPTRVALLNVNSIPFQLRFSPSLANKPKPPPPSSPDGRTETRRKKPFNPFENPTPAMVVCDVEPGHRVVLNKFAIVPEHFILATKEFKRQADLLEEGDLEAAMRCIEVYEECADGGYKDYKGGKDGVQRGDADGREGGGGDGREGVDRGEGGDDNVGKGELFVFFNSGEHSGASQPHRHLQLLSVERMKEGLGGTGKEGDWDVVAKGLVDGRGGRMLPFRTFAERIHGGMDGDALRVVYLRLYCKGCEALGVDAEGQVDGEARISYNLAMTGDVMVLVPRVAEGAELRNGGEVVGKLALNGTVLAGTGLVKSQAEWDALRDDPDQVVEVLNSIGIPTESVPAVRL